MKMMNFTNFFKLSVVLAVLLTPILGSAQTGTLACNDLVQISLGDNCDGVFANQFEEGVASPLPVSHTITINGLSSTTAAGAAFADGAAIVWGDLVGEGTVKFTLLGTFADGSTNTCWGSVIIEDNLAPTLTGGLPCESAGGICGSPDSVESGNEAGTASAADPFFGCPSEVIVVPIPDIASTTCVAGACVAASCTSTLTSMVVNFTVNDGTLETKIVVSDGGLATNIQFNFGVLAAGSYTGDFTADLLANGYVLTPGTDITFHVRQSSAGTNDCNPAPTATSADYEFAIDCPEEVACGGEITGHCSVECVDDPEAHLPITMADITPLLVDNCNDFGSITYKETSSEIGCDTIQVNRTWYTTYNDHGVEVDLALGTQTYFILPLCIDSVRMPHAVHLECNGDPASQSTLAGLIAEYDDPKTPINEAIPYVYPHYENKSGDIIALTPASKLCNLSANFSDQVFPTSCEYGMKTLRKWTILDWCTGTIVEEFQVVEVNDNTPPVIDDNPADRTISIEAWVCVARYELPALEHGVYDNCSGASLYVTLDDGTRQYEIGETMSIAEGVHILHYTAEDGCGNKSYANVNLNVIDLAPPVPVCEDEIVVGLTPDYAGSEDGGIAKIFAQSFDNGSHDAGCEGDVYFKVIRMDELNGTLNGYWNDNQSGVLPYYDEFPTDNPAAQCGGFNGDDFDDCRYVIDKDGNTELSNTGTQIFYDDHVKFCCADVGNDIMVRLRVFDVDPGAGGVRPWRMDAESIYTSNVGGTFGFAIEPCSGTPLVNDLAGHYTDCMVRVTVQMKVPPTIICPPAATIGCIDDLDPYTNTVLGVATAEGVCGNPPVSYSDLADFTDPGCGDGVIIRTWFVDFNGNGELDLLDEFNYQCIQLIFVGVGDDFDPLTIKWPPHYTGQRSAGINRECNPDYWPNEPITAANMPVIETPVFVSTPDALDCMYEVPCIPEWETTDCNLVGYSLEVDTIYFEGDACIKILKHWSVIDWCVWEPNGTGAGIFDDDSDFTDRYELIEDWAIGNCEASSCFENTNRVYSRFEAGGFDVDGHYDWTQVIKVVNYTAPELENCEDVCIPADGDCYGSLIVSNSATDAEDCASDWLKWKVEVFNVFWQRISVWEGATENGGTVEVDAGQHGLGTYYVRWTTHDGCNNTGNCTQVYTIADKKAPTPYCIQSLSTAVMDQSGSVAIWATDFDKGSFDNCTVQSELQFSFDGDEYQPAVTISCIGGGGDLEIANGISETFELQMWVWDAAGNKDFCYVTLRVDDNLDVCEDVEPGARGTIQGTTLTEAGTGVEEAQIDVNTVSNESYVDMTDNSGAYAFGDMNMNVDYTIGASRTGDYLNGVSTLDIILIQQHILAIQDLNSAYKVISADVNNDEKVSSQDIVELRKLILGIYNELPNNESWRFVDATQEFVNNNNPWPLTEAVSINDMTQTMTENFIGMKIGDVNGNAKSNSATSVEGRSNGEMVFNVADVTVTNGSEVRVAVSSSNFNDVYGYQFTMNHTGLSYVGVESGSIVMTDANVASLDNNMTVSWNNHAGVSSNDVLFTMIFTATNNVTLSNALSINSSVTKAEAYVGSDLSQNDVTIEFRTENGATVSTGFVLNQNEPNPFTEKTVISFELPSAAAATMTIMDVTGKVVKTVKGDYAKGSNEITVLRADLPAGVLYYQLESGEHTATMKMVVIE